MSARNEYEIDRSATGHLLSGYRSCMKSAMKWPLTQLCYAGACAVIALIAFAISAGGDASFFGFVGAFAGLIAALYLLAGLFGIAKVLQED